MNKSKLKICRAFKILISLGTQHGSLKVPPKCESLDLLDLHDILDYKASMFQFWRAIGSI
jgi:hypothetical protein